MSDDNDQDSIAYRVLTRVLHDGTCRQTRLGIPREKFAARIGRPTRDHLGNIVGFVFSDGSEIEESGGIWDTPEGWKEYEGS
jgi:hypothetical protein